MQEQPLANIKTALPTKKQQAKILKGVLFLMQAGPAAFKKCY